MPSMRKTGCDKNNRVGYIAIGFSVEENYWYSSEGVFASEDDAIKDLNNLYEVDVFYSVKVQLKRT